MVLRQAQPQRCCWAGGRGQTARKGLNMLNPEERAGSIMLGSGG